MRKRKREILLQFIISLVISVFFWLSIYLSNEYTHLLSLPIKYQNYPSNEILVTKLPKNLEITISGKGLDLLKPVFYMANDTIEIDLTDALKNGFIKTENKLNVEKFSKDITILNVFPDSITLKFEKEFQKKVPIYPNLNFDLKEGYGFASALQFYPDSVIIKGTEKDLKNIHYWETQPISLEVIGKGDVEIPLKFKDNIAVFPNSIILKYNIQKFVEGLTVVPIEVENIPLNKTIRLYPNTLSIRFVTTYDNFAKIHPTHFRATIDYKKILHDFDTVVPEIKVDTSIIKSFYPTPKGVKYIVRSF